MRNKTKQVLAAAALSFAFIISSSPVLAGPIAPAHIRPAFAVVGEAARPPIGWIEFCSEFPGDCVNDSVTDPRDATLSPKLWSQLVAINKQVNRFIKPMTDLEHYGVVEKWTYPIDGYGDCEDYVLMKRRMLIEAGFPREALLITVVRDQKGDGHAVLTVKTNKGELILDNQVEDIVSWLDSPYRFVKRQSQANPSVWVLLGDPRAATATASSR